MIKALAEKLAKVVLPLLLVELVNLVEKLLDKDIDGDGDIGV